MDIQIKYDVVKSDKYINMSFARPSGFFGMSLKGTKLSQEHKEKIRKTATGKKRGKYLPMTDEAKLKHSEAVKGEKNPMFGKTHPSKGKNIITRRCCCVVCGAESTVSAITRYHAKCHL